MRSSLRAGPLADAGRGRPRAARAAPRGGRRRSAPWFPCEARGRAVLRRRSPGQRRGSLGARHLPKRSSIWPSGGALVPELEGVVAGVRCDPTYGANPLSQSLVFVRNGQWRQRRRQLTMPKPRPIQHSRRGCTKVQATRSLSGLESRHRPWRHTLRRRGIAVHDRTASCIGRHQQRPQMHREGRLDTPDPAGMRHRTNRFRLALRSHFRLAAGRVDATGAASHCFILTGAAL
jgi:hypothetical protein